MLGLGETTEEVVETLADLRSDRLRLADARPVPPALAATLPVVRYCLPRSSTSWAGSGPALGFVDVASGPFVRSSYHADEMARGTRAGSLRYPGQIPRPVRGR